MAIANETLDDRPISSVFAAGRVFYLVNNIIYYSQVMEGSNISYLAKCYSKNDPTAEQVSDLLATDGGTITINEAGRGVKLVETKSGVLILCDNGVWELSGPDSGFKATSFSLRKVTKYGCTSAQAVVEVSDAVYYWGLQHIHRLQTNEFGNMTEVSLTEDTIEAFYRGISHSAKKFASGFFNSATGEIEWFYSTATTATGIDLPYSHDRGLNLSVKTGGFFPQQYNGKIAGSSTAASSVYTGVDLSCLRDDAIYYISSHQEDTSGTVSTFKMQTGQKSDATFQDFGVNYPTAYVETGYETLAKPSNKKVAPYITTHFAKTEQNWVADGSGGFALDLQSGCQMRAKWDWNDSSTNGRWAPAQQVYRFRRTNIPSGAGAFDSGETVISTKNKMLGRGNALSVRFEQEAGKDMQLLGYTVQWSVKGRM